MPGREIGYGCRAGLSHLFRQSQNYRERPIIPGTLTPVQICFRKLEQIWHAPVVGQWLPSCATFHCCFNSLRESQQELVGAGTGPTAG